MIPHSVGVIDSDYRGTIKVILKNIGDDPYKIEVGDRIAQLVIQKVELVRFTDIWNDTQRGTGGFGSTGT
jgi:dUTP pyrophosphatase